LEGELRESALLRVSMSWRNLVSPEEEFAVKEAAVEVEVAFPERGFPAMAGSGKWEPLTGFSDWGGMKVTTARCEGKSGDV
jgi:hypothetical protein